MMNLQPLTRDEMKQVEEWEKSPDPFVRLTNPYYTLSRLAILEDYKKAIAAANDMEEYYDARSTMLGTLKTLRQDCIADIELCMELLINKQGFSPVQFKLVIQED